MKRLSEWARQIFIFLRHGFTQRGSRLQAFTLLELMVVVVILGILAAFIVPRISKRPEDARVTKAKIEISRAGNAQILQRIYPRRIAGGPPDLEPPLGGCADRL